MQTRYCYITLTMLFTLLHVISFKILANMSKQGTSCLSDAHEYFNMCYVAGLLPRNFDLSKPQDRSVSSLHSGLVTIFISNSSKLPLFFSAIEIASIDDFIRHTQSSFCHGHFCCSFTLRLCFQLPWNMVW